MRTFTVPRYISRGCTALLAGTAAVTTHAQAADWTKHFRVGMQVTLNIEAEFSGGGLFDIPTRPGRYNNGYVLADSTGSTVDPPVTTNWGYDSDNQFDPATRLMTFSRAESFSGQIGDSTKDDSPYLGLELAYGAAITRWGDAVIGWEAGYSFLPISISDNRSASGFTTIGTYSYHIPDGVIVPPPGHRGTATGGGQPVIERDLVGDPVFDDIAGRASVSRKLDASLHTLRGGPTINLDLARRWSFQGGLGPAIGYVTGDYKFDERTTATAGGTSNRAEGEIGGDDFVFGGYAQALLLFHFEEHGDIYAGLQYMGLTGSDFEDGDRRAKLNLGATLSFLVGVNWPF